MMDSQTYCPKMMMMMNTSSDKFGCLTIPDQPSVIGGWEMQHPTISQNYVDLPSSLYEDPFDPYYANVYHGIHQRQQPQYFLQDFEEICDDLGMLEYNQNATPMCLGEDGNILNALDQGHKQMIGNQSYYTSQSNNARAMKRQSGRHNKSNALELDEIKKYFDLPITKAAKQLNVGLTVLKKRCRELNIMRWPHRKLKSLTSLIDNVKEMGLFYEVEMLEEHKRLLEMVPELELTEETKKLRQACFKANYKKRRSMMLQQANSSLI